VRLPRLQMRRWQMRLEALRGLWRLWRLLPALGPLPRVLGLRGSQTNKNGRNECAGAPDHRAGSDAAN
jgi:hypothetical protein